MSGKLINDLAKGTWSGATAYTVGDIVDNNGSSYICIANSTNNEPPNVSYWALLAQAGTDGIDGADGEVSLNGVQTLTNKTLTSPVLTTPQINDTSSDHQYIYAGSELIADRTVTLPLLTGNDEFVFKDHAQTLTNKTMTSPVFNTGVSGTAILDEDTMVSDSATKVPTQQSVKAYVDSVAGAATGAGADGWKAATGTWTYSSPTTISVQSGAAALYQKGDKVKLTQTTAKYFIIVTVADTLLTVTGGSDYTVANAAITSPYYSHQENPIGFPYFFNYTPTGIAASNVTLTGQFRVSGLECHVRMKIAFSGAITFTTMPTLPIAAVAFVSGTDIYPVGIGGYNDSGTGTFPTGLVPGVSSGALTIVQVLKSTDASAMSASVPITWANGDSIILDFTYKI